MHLINVNMERRFGFLDESMNPDLTNIVIAYQDDDFWLAIDDDKVVATGALRKLSQTEGQIVRMHTAVSRQRSGLGSLMLRKLEERARMRGFSRLVLETNLDWLEAIAFYKRNGYSECHRNSENIHFKKLIR